MGQKLGQKLGLGTFNGTYLCGLLPPPPPLYGFRPSEGSDLSGHLRNEFVLVW